MIPAANITEWGVTAAWPTRQQIEQDLLLSRLIIEIAQNNTLGPELAFRGGTCLHKLHLPTPLRYSEDLDYVRTTSGSIGPFIDVLREVTKQVGLTEKSRQPTSEMFHFICTADAEDGGKLTVKIEINVVETTALLGHKTFPLEVKNGWWSGNADISTFSLEELMATKFRALYQRRKGRDLFDLWHVLTFQKVDDRSLVTTMQKYMGNKAFNFSQLRENLIDKLNHPDYDADLLTLITQVPSNYDSSSAADLTMERLGVHLNNAPPLKEVIRGQWRR